MAAGDELTQALQPPFYQAVEFWISTVIGIVGLVFSWLAWVAAKAAQREASAVGTTVKIQTITIELSEIAQRLDKLDFDVEFSEARDFLNEISRRLMRLVAPFQAQEEIAPVFARLRASLNDAKAALESVRPLEMEGEVASQNSVYFATQGHFSNISMLVAEIMGLFEKRTIGGGNK